MPLCAELSHEDSVQCSYHQCAVVVTCLVECAFCLACMGRLCEKTESASLSAHLSLARANACGIDGNVYAMSIDWMKHRLPIPSRVRSLELLHDMWVYNRSCSCPMMC